MSTENTPKKEATDNKNVTSPSSIRLKANLNKEGITEVKALITHPMETGLRIDQATGELIPAHFIEEVVVEHNGKPVLSTEWGNGISRGPYCAFKFKGGKAGDKIKLSWKDNRGKQDTGEAIIES